MEIMVYIIESTSAEVSAVLSIHDAGKYEVIDIRTQTQPSPKGHPCTLVYRGYRGAFYCDGLGDAPAEAIAHLRNTRGFPFTSPVSSVKYLRV
jgi:hypothetical protein